MRTLLLILLAAGTALAQGGAPTGPPQGPPPKNLTKQADGHISANALPANPGDFEVHTVVAGDTLSEIAEMVLRDVKLWPQLWEQNEHIVNPHWIYPNDKILIRRVTRVSDATPPAPAAPPAPAPAPAPAPVNPGPPRPPTRLNVAPYPTPPPAVPPATFNLAPPRNFSEVKDADLYCSGFIRRPSVSDEMKVTSLANSDTAILASDGNYINVGKGTRDGVRVGSTYQVVRPTRSVDSPSRAVGDRDLGRHYLEIAQVQVVLGQDNTAMARVTQSCEAVEQGDLVLPYTRAQFPALPSRRPFSATMTASGQMPGKIVMTKNVLVNFGSSLKGTTRLAGVGQGQLGDLERGIAGENRVVYLDLGRSSGAKPGDLFIVYRDMDSSDGAGKRRTAIGEVVILRVEDRASTALVTYSTDGIALGDSVERR